MSFKIIVLSIFEWPLKAGSLLKVPAQLFSEARSARCRFWAKVLSSSILSVCQAWKGPGEISAGSYESSLVPCMISRKVL